MTGPKTRIVRVDLNYGRHREVSFDLSADGRPVVILGPNGAGKTTLLEALGRGLCGFNRRVDDDRSLFDARREGLGSSWCRLRLLDSTGRSLDLYRTFDDSRVEITEVESGAVLFHGDANPGGDNEDTRAYRHWLQDLLGFVELDPYRRTAFVAQGELIHTQLDQDLLRAATGGGGGVHGALENISRKHRELTVRPLLEGGSRARKDREIEGLEARLHELREQLDRTEELERRRERVLSEMNEVEAAYKSATGRRDRLRAALEPLYAEDSITLEADRFKVLHERADRLATNLRHAAAEALRAERDNTPPADRYPDDFRETVAAARELWPRRQALLDRLGTMRQARDENLARASMQRSAGIVGVSVAVVLTVAAAITGFVWLWAVAALAAVAGAWLLLARGVRPAAPEDLIAIEEELAVIDKRLGDLSDSLPGGSRLGQDTVDLHLSRFDRQREAELAQEEAEEKLDRAMNEAQELLRAESPRDQDGGLPDHSDALVRRLEDLSREAVQAHARKELELEDKRQQVDLPEDVSRDPRHVDRALKQTEDEVDDLARHVQELTKKLHQEASPTRSSTALRDEIARTKVELISVEERVEALKQAHSLLRVAYESFREGDEDRLLGQVSDRLHTLTGGELGPVKTDGDLHDATVVLYGREVSLDSPGLSYGERMAIRLAIRLAATDFLGRGGVRPPLIVDEPFDDLDPGRARGAWELLCRVAEERQVIVASQDRLVVDWLGVEPDVELERERSGD